jgi:hypothetical protein
MTETIEQDVFLAVDLDEGRFSGPFVVVVVDVGGRVGVLGPRLFVKKKALGFLSLDYGT